MVYFTRQKIVCNLQSQQLLHQIYTPACLHPLFGAPSNCIIFCIQLAFLSETLYEKKYLKGKRRGNGQLRLHGYGM